MKALCAPCMSSNFACFPGLFVLLVCNAYVQRHLLSEAPPFKRIGPFEELDEQQKTFMNTYESLGTLCKTKEHLGHPRNMYASHMNTSEA